MNDKSKANSGLKKSLHFNHSERHKIIQELISSGSTKQQIWEKYTGDKYEHGQIVRWMRELGYINEYPIRRPNFVANNNMMTKKPSPEKSPGDSFEILQMKKRIAELENQLKNAEMKAIAFSTMIDIAEKEFNIPIRKKANTKPLKK
jgi:transposase